MASSEQTRRDDKVNTAKKPPELVEQGGAPVSQGLSQLAGVVAQARVDAGSLPPGGVLQLQRSLGNRVVGGLLAGAEPGQVSRKAETPVNLAGGSLRDRSVVSAPPPVFSNVIQRLIEGLEEYQEANSIPPQWVDAFIADIGDSQTHLYAEDVVAYLNEKEQGWDNDAILVHKGDHWDVTLNKEKGKVTVVTIADGSCGAYAIHAIQHRANINADTEKYQADNEFVTTVRTWIKERNEQDKNEVKARIASQIKDGELIITTGFGPQLQGILEDVVKRKQAPVSQATSTDLAGEEKLHKPKEEKKVKGTVAKETSASKGVDKFKATAKVGLELTFWSKDTKKYLTNQGFPSPLKEKAKNWWEDMLEQWVKDFDALDYSVSEAQRVGKNKDFGGGTGEMEIVRVTHKGYVEGKEIFWWQLSMDPGVVEIQTCPVTGSELADSEGAVNEIITKIYKRAEELDFKPGGGGGHVNVDFETGVGGNYSLIPKILMATETIINNLRRVSEDNSLVEFSHEQEDPFISTDRYAMKMHKHKYWDRQQDPKNSERNRFDDWHKEVYEKSGVKVKDEKTLATFKEAHAKWLFLHPTVGQYLKADQPDAKMPQKLDEESDIRQVLHYQAVNIEHLFDKIASERRLEFRFFRGQENLEEIVASIELISKIIAEAKTYK